MVLYTTGCPQCKLVEKKLMERGMKYEEVKDVDVILGMGFTSVPVLEADGEFFCGAKQILNFLGGF